MESISWWCPKCKAPILNRKPCPRCRTERVNSWKCDNCNSIVVDSRSCKKCGRKRATTIYNRMLVGKLFDETGPSGHRNIEILRKFAYRLAVTKNIPQYLVEDAIATALEKLVREFKSYDAEKGSFRTWAIAILKNTLYDAAREDSRENRIGRVSLDAEGDDGTLTMESVLGYTYGAEDLVAAEEKQRFVAMAALARRVFGSYATVVGGQPVELSVYDLCIRLYESRDGYGWRSMAARVMGVSKQTITRKQDTARSIWRQWNGMDSEEEAEVATEEE